MTKILLHSSSRKDRIFKKYKTFFLFYFGCLLSSLSLVAVVNIIIDPYQYFFTKKISGLNEYKPEYREHEMLSKAAEIKHINAETILLGSSRVMMGLNTSNPVFSEPKTVYNLGLPGTNMYESLQYFKHALTFQKNIKQVVIGVDFFMFNKNLENLDNFDEARLGKTIYLKDLMNTTLSIDTLDASLSTIEANYSGDHLKKTEESTRNKFRRWIEKFLNYEGFYKTYTLSEEQLNYFKTLINLCEKNNIDYYVFISPTHATQYEAIDVAGLWNTFEDWKRAIVHITPVWDFSGYNSVTTEAISESMINYIDSSHYSPHTGDLVLYKMLGDRVNTVPQDFGVLIDRNNLKPHFQRIKLERQQWRKNNQKEFELVRKIKANLK